MRKAARDRRAAAHGAVDPAPALEALRRVLYQRAGAISFYWPIRTEIDPTPVMETLAAERVVCLPVTHGRDAALTFRAWRPGSAMDTDGFGVLIPSVDEAITPEILVVPMLAFDNRLHRLGYGAGHYDRTLAGLRPNGRAFAIGLAYEAQWTEDLPIEATDQALDMVITEARVRFPPG